MCPTLEPIGLKEFQARRRGLAQRLSSNDMARDTMLQAYVTEPSVNTLYYLNITSEDWFLSERPWLLVVTPRTNASDATHTKPDARVAILTPSFELSRSKRLPLAMTRQELDDIKWLTYREDENPYDVVANHIVNNRFAEVDEWPKARGTVHVEENVRQFVASGIRDAVSRKGQFEVDVASLDIRRQRMKKTGVELAIQRCVAKITVHALRAVQRQLYIGMTEKDGERLITKALRAGGLTDLDAIVLFGANAALPHASASHGKKLEHGEFVLMDVGGRLQGYMSDFTRTMLPESSRNQWPSDESKTIWTTVNRAQIEALYKLQRTNVTAGSVDAAARQVITDEGYGPFFTHRLGHGIGLQVHEEPYLRGANDEVLVPGETFSNEPGIYIEQGDKRKFEGKGIGVRLEDMVLKTETGWQLVSDEDLAQTPWDP
ncbi:hypothetical protein OIO90_000406 [Microbotryomycetes sp. JL221]|nr:hypothetical protein OIO90_000406 [Microbotryomycetes sp. JL221]